MKLYFYTANTINGYCDKLGVVVTVSKFCFQNKKG